jgi:hypothetical protein
MTRVWTCEDAVARLLEPDSSVPPELAAHLERCEECRLVSRDVGALRAMIADARDDVDKNVPAPDVLAALGLPSEERDQLPTELRSAGHHGLRLVHDASPDAPPVPTRGRDLAGPVAASARRGAPGRVIPLAVAIAAALVAVTAAWVLLREDPPRPEPRDELVLQATRERAPTPERAVAVGEQPPIVVAPSPVVAPSAVPQQNVEQPSRPGAPRSIGSDVGMTGEGSRERRSVGTGSRPPSSSVAPPPSEPQALDGPAPEVLAQRSLRGQTPRLQSCYERALRRDLRLRDATAEVTVDISPEGGVESVSASGDASADLRRCLEQAVRAAHFPESDSGMRVSVPLRFEVVRERMGTNVRPGGTTPE